MKKRNCLPIGRKRSEVVVYCAKHFYQYAGDKSTATLKLFGWCYSAERVLIMHHRIVHSGYGRISVKRNTFVFASVSGALSWESTGMLGVRAIQGQAILSQKSEEGFPAIA